MSIGSRILGKGVGPPLPHYPILSTHYPTIPLATAKWDRLCLKHLRLQGVRVVKGCLQLECTCKHSMMSIRHPRSNMMKSNIPQVVIGKILASILHN